MSFVKRITVHGFRGILAPLELTFKINNLLSSMTVFGRNGHGKSSITDAWEWFKTNRIERLGREGAGPNTFPHRKANVADGLCYVEVEFADNVVGRTTFNQKKITSPTATAGVTAFRKRAPYPCHLRYEDLNRFVYLTKAEQYDSLATLMDFTSQVEFQKKLRRVSRRLMDETTSRTAVLSSERTKLVRQIGDANPNEATMLKYINLRLKDAKSKPVKSLQAVTAALKLINAAIENDPRTQSLADHKAVQSCIIKLKCASSILPELLGYVKEIEMFKAEERSVVDLMLIGLYEKGRDIVKERGGVTDIPCPLCGIEFEGDLAEHIENELTALKELKSVRDKLDASRKRLGQELTPFASLVITIVSGIKHIKNVADSVGIKALQESCGNLDAVVAEILLQLKVTPDKVTSTTAEALSKSTRTLKTHCAFFEKAKAALLTNLDTQILSLQDDGHRTNLVKASQDVASALQIWTDFEAAASALSRLEKTREDFEAITDSYIVSSNSEIESKFTSISADVDKYFGILEEHTEGVGQPVLRLQADQDRAVTLEVEFRGEKISPAYKYLSESQLNSFGLSLFLASAKRFNQNFRFLILDDIVNSFDAYKRPQLIKLLKEEFYDFQFLLLTHDDVWCDQLFRCFPRWIRKRFIRHDVNHGPIISDGLTDIEKVCKDLDDDQPSRAGQLLGPMLERELQELCEAFQATVAYTRKNEHTLQPLLTRLIERSKDKLTVMHPFCVALKSLDEDLGFRNFCAHWKDPTSPLTTQEMRGVLQKWNNVESIARCSEQKCANYVRYDNKNCFVCSCKKTKLDKHATK